MATSPSSSGLPALDWEIRRFSLQAQKSFLLQPAKGFEKSPCSEEQLWFLNHTCLYQPYATITNNHQENYDAGNCESAFETPNETNRCWSTSSDICTRVAIVKGN